MLRLPENKETYMAVEHDFRELVNLDFRLKDLLDWVDQLPLEQARDTHALHFDLKESSEPQQSDPEQPRPSMQYQGLMFYLPGALTSQNVNVLLGLEGFGNLVATDKVCERVLGSLSPSPDIDHIWRGLQWVQVRIRIKGRPGVADAEPQLFSQLAFFTRPNSLEAEVGKILGPVTHQPGAVRCHYLARVGLGEGRGQGRLANRIVMEAESHVPGGPVNPLSWIMDLQKTTVLLNNTPP
jgi:hypothetical protein